MCSRQRNIQRPSVCIFQSIAIRILVGKCLHHCCILSRRRGHFHADSIQPVLTIKNHVHGFGLYTGQRINRAIHRHTLQLVTGQHSVCIGHILLIQIGSQVEEQTVTAPLGITGAGIPYIDNVRKIAGCKNDVAAITVGGDRGSFDFQVYPKQIFQSFNGRVIFHYIRRRQTIHHRHSGTVFSSSKRQNCHNHRHTQEQRNETLHKEYLLLLFQYSFALLESEECCTAQLLGNAVCRENKNGSNDILKQADGRGVGIAS